MANIAPSRAAKVLERCRELARITDVPGETTRLFLSRATQGAHALLQSWMMQAGLETRVDQIGNVRGVRRSTVINAPTLLLFSHIDTVPNAGPFDGTLGVLLSLGIMKEMGTQALPFHIELLAFSEEEGIRFSLPFISSLAATGELTSEHLLRTDKDGVTLAQAVTDFGLNPSQINQSCRLSENTFAALEVHIEQGPLLEAHNTSIAVVQSIIGQSRLRLTFEGQANHAGTTPMPLRHDALASAAHWITEVERFALDYNQLVATVGRIEALPGAANVVPGLVTLTLDVRHPSDDSRHAAVGVLLNKAQHAGDLRGVKVKATITSEQRSVPMDTALTASLAGAAERAGHPAISMFSGAGHDAMILASHVATTMLFLRSPGGLSHHPGETVREEDVEAAMSVVSEWIKTLDPQQLA